LTAQNFNIFTHYGKSGTFKAEDMPHYITQRVSRRQQTCFSEESCERMATFRYHERTGRPLSSVFLMLEEKLDKFKY
jgi:hypothetical protein